MCIKFQVCIVFRLADRSRIDIQTSPQTFIRAKIGIFSTGCSPHADFDISFAPMAIFKFFGQFIKTETHIIITSYWLTFCGMLSKHFNFFLSFNSNPAIRRRTVKHNGCRFYDLMIIMSIRFINTNWPTLCWDNFTIFRFSSVYRLKASPSAFIEMKFFGYCFMYNLRPPTLFQIAKY